MAYTDWTFSKSKEFYEKLREHILESDEYEGVVLCDGMEYAFLGLANQFSKPPIAVYDRERCIELLARDMTYEEAVEYFEYNVIGAWVGEQTPMFLTRGEALSI